MNRPEHLPLNVATCGTGPVYYAITADFDAGKVGLANLVHRQEPGEQGRVSRSPRSGSTGSCTAPASRTSTCSGSLRHQRGCWNG
jgi:hypothetical protein